MKKENTIDELISSIDIEEVKSALAIAEAEQIDLGLADYDTLWRAMYQHHTRFKRADEIPIEEKIQSLNKYNQYKIIVRKYPTEIPPIYKLNNLERLVIEFNNYSLLYNRSILHYAFQLTTLKELVLKRYTLKFLDSAIQQLEKLEILDLKGNRIEELPDSILELKHLKKIVLTHNPIDQSNPVLIALKTALPTCEIDF